MNYLSPSEYEAHGLDATTPEAWITAASAVIDAHCRRATLGIAQYQERLRVSPGRNTVRLAYLPLATVAPATTPILAARGRYGVPRRGESPWGELGSDVAVAFGLPGAWVEIDPANTDYSAETGELTLPVNALGLGFSELEVTYTAGLETVTQPIKVACGQIVRNAQATPALNVRAGKLDRMQLHYFSESLLDDTVRSLLAPFVAQKVG
jgi:hypothetical protein